MRYLDSVRNFSLKKAKCHKAWKREHGKPDAVHEMRGGETKACGQMA